MSADELASLMNDLLRRFNTTKRQLPGARSSAVPVASPPNLL
jgi:hypothetical protein